MATPLRSRSRVLESAFDEQSVEIGPATWTSPDAGAKVPQLDQNGN